MLIISGLSLRPCKIGCERFNLAIEMLIISGRYRPAASEGSRRSFNLAIEMLIISGTDRERTGNNADSAFQSRNRDAYHFRARAERADPSQAADRFNLAIEMLIISGVTLPFLLRPTYQSFNLAIEMLIISGYRETHGHLKKRLVSISQSRCLSFQDRCRTPAILARVSRFQSRNRDAYHFRNIILISFASPLT